jgi:hypothetical protein
MSAVLPSGSSKAAIANETTAIAISPVDLTLDRIVL